MPRINLPVNDRRVEFGANQNIVSTTDEKGRITYVNSAFIEVSGFSREDVLGQAHNIVRHPDMPAIAFEDMWATLKKGKPWTGIVKNRCKDGSYYWVEANVSPIVQNEKIVGYTSIRTKPTEDQVRAADSLYTQWNQGKAQHIQLKEGLLIDTRMYIRWASFLKEQWTLRLFGILVFLMLLGTFAFLFRDNYWFSLGLTAALNLLIVGQGIYYKKHIMRPIKNIQTAMQKIAGGELSTRLDLQEAGELKPMTQALNQAVCKLTAVLQEIKNHAMTSSICVQQVSSGSHVLNQSVEAQATAISSMVSNTLSISSKATENAKTAESVQATAKLAELSAQTAQDLMTHLASKVESTNTSLDLLRDLSAQISEIAAQTGILALNARIEAARAGDAGKGFSVVAGAVYDLAKKSAEVATIASKTALGMRQDVSQCSELAIKAQDAFGNMASTVSETNHACHTLSEAAENQAREVQQAQQNIAVLESSLQQTTFVANESLQATDKALNEAKLLVQAVDIFK